MRKLILSIVIILFLISTKTAFASYDPLSVPNNKIGIHILETTELENAATLVNSNGGDWGYVTMPIRANDRNLSKWQEFMANASKLHLIPILRLASFPVDDYWTAPNELDLIDFANFLDELTWPTNNRYVVIYNEPNHKNEWGGFVYPEEYAKILDRAVDTFHKTNQDFFVISAGFDSSAPDSEVSLNEYSYMTIMEEAVPGVFNKVDGFSSHSYGNPGFSTYPNIYSSVSVANYRFEQKLLSSFGVKNPKIFITEAGWRSQKIGDPVVANYLQLAFDSVWVDPNIIAITPFVLSAQAGAFKDFSFYDENNHPKMQAETISNLVKTKGQPQLAIKQDVKSDKMDSSWTGNSLPTSNFNWLESLKVVFSRMFHFPK